MILYKFASIALVTQLRRIIETNMRGLLIIAFCAVYSVQAWNQEFSNIHVETQTGQLPQKYYPLSSDDNHATRKAGAFVSFVKIVPQLNPLQVPSLGPYTVDLQEVDFRGDLQLHNVVVNGIKYVALQALEVRMSPTRVDFNASVPKVTAEIDYALKGALGRENLDVYGHISATLQGLSVSVAAGPKIAQVQGSQVYQVDSADAKIDLSNLQLSMGMNQHAEEFRNILVEFLNHPYKYSGIVDDLLRNVLKAINHELTQITAKEILQYLLGSSKLGRSG